MASQAQKHLRTYVEDGIQQKVRLSNLTKSYKDQEFKSNERIIDQVDLVSKMITQKVPQIKVDLVKERRDIDVQNLERVKNVLEKTKLEMEGLTLRMNAHLEELTELEILAGGFIAHSIGVGKNVKFDKDNRILSFTPGGYVEIPIAARLSKWKDSSQMTIRKIQKAEV